MKRSDARYIALDILMRYEKEGKKLGPLLLDVLETDSNPDKRDRAFVTAIVEGVTERRMSLDWVIDQVSQKKTDSMKPVVRNIIRIGAYQLLFMDRVPDSAAVNESVKLARLKHLEGLSGFVNAVLRGVIRLRDDGITYPDIETEYSCPRFISELLEEAYGREKAEAMIRSTAGNSPLYLRVNRTRTSAKELQEILEGEGVLADTVADFPDTLKVRPLTLDPSRSESFLRGLYSVQDLSSQSAMYALKSEIVGYISSNNPVDIKIIDMCASPGGKSCFIAEALNADEGINTGFSIESCDISEAKLIRIRENISRTGIGGITPVVRDAASYDPSLKESADVIIADLPCSGLGVIGRKVDIKYRVTRDDIKELCKLQRKMLENAADYLKPGGLLLYSVCTVTAEETTGQHEFIESQGLDEIASRLFLQGIDDCDGFYYSIWKKKEDASLKEAAP